MPLQNRVQPTGEIVSDPARGMLMGNRGSIHQLDRTLGVTRWRTKMWISCVLDWYGRKRDVMPPGRWTALFFLDEATALAAGHGPCGYCRRADHRWFGASWQAAQNLAVRPYAWEMDVALHAERVVSRTRAKITRPAHFGELPDGAMVSYLGEPGPGVRRPPAALVFRRLPSPPASQSRHDGRPAHSPVHRGRAGGRLPAAGTPKRRVHLDALVHQLR